MPLIKGSSKRAISQNIKTERHAGKPRAQSVAIALRTAEEARKKRGRSEPGIPLRRMPSKK